MNPNGKMSDKDEGGKSFVIKSQNKIDFWTPAPKNWNLIFDKI